MRSLGYIFFAVLLFSLTSAQPALAVIQYYNVFKKEYLDNHPDKEYAAALTKASDKCYVCHQGRKSKKHHNAFGVHLVEPLDRKKDMKDVAKISAEIKKVLAMHVDPNDEKSETYADRVNASKWPGGELEELKKEPAEDDAGK
jgi:cytochrome c2